MYFWGGWWKLYILFCFQHFSHEVLMISACFFSSYVWLWSKKSWKPTKAIENRGQERTESFFRLKNIGGGRGAVLLLQCFMKANQQQNLSISKHPFLFIVFHQGSVHILRATLGSVCEVHSGCCEWCLWWFLIPRSIPVMGFYWSLQWVKHETRHQKFLW